MSGAEKAVLFLLSLDEEIARPIFKELSEADMRKLKAVASTMREVPTGALEETYREFLTRSNAAVAVPRGGLPYLRQLSVSTLGETRAHEIFDGGVTSPFTRLEGASPETVASLLAVEPPQLAAAVLARMECNHAASVLTALDPERQAAVIAHVSRLTELPAHVVDDVANALARELPTDDATTLVTVDGIAVAAAMLNALGAAATPILAAVESEDALLATQVRQAMFTFSDLQRVDGRAMREILREVPTERLVIALKGSGDEVVSAVFAGLSARAAELIRDDLELLGKVKKADIDAARREVLEVAMRLEAEGKIDLGREVG